MTATETPSQLETRKLARAIAIAAEDRKAADIVILEVAEVSYLADYFVIVTGFSQTQVRAISDSIEDKISKELDRNPLRVEGKSQGNWILQDYGDVIVHIMLEKDREFYNLEAFWGHAKKINFSTISETSSDRK
ncbi:MAG: ribosome silencing factor [Prochloraceae cyanobacterium]|nr:ribosome silencing factor [Prochloraceae cyanobacterium]